MDDFNPADFLPSVPLQPEPPVQHERPPTQFERPQNHHQRPPRSHNVEQFNVPETYNLPEQPSFNIQEGFDPPRGFKSAAFQPHFRPKEFRPPKPKYESPPPEPEYAPPPPPEVSEPFGHHEPPPRRDFDEGFHAPVRQDYGRDYRKQALPAVPKSLSGYQV